VNGTHPRIGLLIPSSNLVMERDLHRELDSWAEVHTARMYMVETTRDGEQHMLDVEAEPAVRRIATVEPDLIVFGCTSASSLHGRDYDDEFRGRLSEIAGVPVLGVLASVIEELADAGPVALFTPYVDELTGTIADSLVADGIDVISKTGLGIEKNLDIGELEPDDIVREVGALDLGPAETLFCSCTNLRAYEVRQRLAEKTGRRVVTSNQAVVARLQDRLRRA
jgi:maleate isomerase